MQQLADALAEVQRLQAEQERLEQELVDTNRGVVALYAELDDRAERLRLADEAKSRFLSGVSHELRTPLNSILALSKLLLDRVDGPLSDEQEKQVAYIRKSSEDLLGLVNSLLDLSRIEAGRAEILIRDFSLADLFVRLEGELQPLRQGTQVTLVFERPDPSLQLTTDEGKVRQIVRNFVSNALKYTERGEVRVRSEVLGDVVRIAVSDTGLGIAAQDRDRIFEEFTQIPNPLQARVRGTGLGLPLSRALTNLLGGRVGVESELGAGSTFWAELPIRHGVPSVPSSPVGVPAEAVTPAVLIIDDDPITRYVVGQMLRLEGYEVAEATGGIDGLAQARGNLPGLIVLDLSMPDLDGTTVLDRLGRDRSTRDIPVIVYTSSELAPRERGRVAEEAAAIIAKSGDMAAELRDVVRLFLPLAQPPSATTKGREP